MAAEGELRDVRGDVLVLCGDIPLIDPDTLSRLITVHREKQAWLTVLTGEPEDPSGYGRVLRESGGGVLGIVEDKDATPKQKQVREINSGIYCIRAEGLFEALRRIRADNVQKEYYLTDLLEIYVRDGKRLAAVKAARPEEILGVNSRSELAWVGQLMRGRILERLMADGVTVVDPETTYVDDHVEVGRDTVIYPFSVIRRGVRIGCRCTIGPFAHIRGGSQIEDDSQVGNFTEVVRTSMGRNSRALHLSYLGDADIGEGVNIGAGTVCANFDGVAKHGTSIGDGAFVGCGTIFVAPTAMAPGSRTGAGAVVRRGERVAEGETWVGMPAKPIGSGKDIES
jgi:bifunctional UDP-N-acetylglucosamine pyrophosphorylase/glucosamine-1-phosphate N-acetyltransferase